jgi:nitrogen fixation/metabolism regulation signal transduction histidine kinase
MINDIDKENFLEELSLISGYTQHLSKTIDDFRKFFKETKEKERVMLKELVTETLQIALVSLKNKNINLITEYNCDKPILTYTSEVKQVLLNFIKNAEDVLLEREIKNPKITIITKNDDTSHILVIKDNAGGIPEKIIDKIYEPYFSTKLEKDGTGLGLYMSKKIIEEHCSGKIETKNDKEGAVFTITLPDLQEK